MTSLPLVPGRRRMTRAERGRQLLAVAEQVFAERGLRAAAMDEIAERAGVTKPVLYDHFGSKDGLLAAVVARGSAELADETAAAVAAAGTPEAALADGVRAYFRFVRAHAGFWAALLAEGPTAAAAADAVEAVRQRQAEYLASLIAAELPARDRRRSFLYAQALVGTCERLAACLLADRTLTPDQLTAAVMDVAWLGFAELRAGSRWQMAGARR